MVAVGRSAQRGLRLWWGALPTYPVEGTVTFPDGTPLQRGWVEFQPVTADQPTSARGQIGPDGRYRLTTFRQHDGAIEGEHRVLVSSPPAVDRDRNPHPQPVTDPRFQRFETSGLSFTVSKEQAQNRFDIQVTPP